MVVGETPKTGSHRRRLSGCGFLVRVCTTVQGATGSLDAVPERKRNERFPESSHLGILMEGRVQGTRERARLRPELVCEERKMSVLSHQS